MWFIYLTNSCIFGWNLLLDICHCTQVVAYFFYKNLTFTLTQFWFTTYTGFSGQRLYDDWFQSLYNVVFTALPVIVVGIFDKVQNLVCKNDHLCSCVCFVLLVK